MQLQLATNWPLTQIDGEDMTEHVPIVISSNLRASHRHAAVYSYLSKPLRIKWPVAIPAALRRQRVLLQAIQGEYGFYATSADQLLGFAGIRTAADLLLVASPLAAFYGSLASFGGSRAAAVLSLFERKPEASEVIIECLAVDDQQRGRKLDHNSSKKPVSWAADKALRMSALRSSTTIRAHERCMND